MLDRVSKSLEFVIASNAYDRGPINFKELAEASLAPLRTPNARMIAAMHDKITDMVGDPSPLSFDELEAAFIAAIDAASTSPPGDG